jgi:hypothetical protein
MHPAPFEYFQECLQIFITKAALLRQPFCKTNVTLKLLRSTNTKTNKSYFGLKILLIGIELNIIEIAEKGKPRIFPGP